MFASRFAGIPAETDGRRSRHDWSQHEKAGLKRKEESPRTGLSFNIQKSKNSTMSSYSFIIASIVE